MKLLVAFVVCFVSVTHAGISGGSSGGWEDQQQEQDAGWPQQQQGQDAGWQQQRGPPQQEQQKIIIIKQQGGGGGGGSLTVAGPTHTIKTIHQVRTIDQGGKILSKMGSSGGQRAKILIVKDVKTAQVKHVMAPQTMQHGGWEPQMMQKGGW